MDGYTRTLKNRAIIREDNRYDMLAAYIVNSGGIWPEQQCEDKKSYDSKVLWWLEPPLPHCENYILIEEEKLDGQWTIRREVQVPKIQVYGS